MNQPPNTPNSFQAQNNNAPQQDKPKSVLAEALPEILIRGAIILFIVGLAVFALYLGSAVIGAVGEQAESFHSYISRLFREAPYMFRRAKGFGAFIQLILIACFVGWVINRFRRK